MSTSRGRCKECGRWLPLTATGRVWLHARVRMYKAGQWVDNDATRCVGSIKKPQRVALVVKPLAE